MRAYETAVAAPEGAHEPRRLARTAARYGYDGLVVTNADHEAVRVAAADPPAGFDLVDGVTLDAEDRETLAGRLSGVRSGGDTRYTVVTAVAGPDDVTRMAAEQDRVDVLVLPAERDVGFDHVVARSAADHAVRVALDLGSVLRTTGDRRTRALRLLRRRREILDDAGTTPLVTARAASRLQLRTPRDLAAVGERVGLGGDRVRAGLAGWGSVVARVRERTHPDFVEPGVWRGTRADRAAARRSAQRSVEDERDGGGEAE